MAIPVLEVSGDHIMQLGDEALRRLVVRLCEAELRRVGLPQLPEDVAALFAAMRQDVHKVRDELHGRDTH